MSLRRKRYAAAAGRPTGAVRRLSLASWMTALALTGLAPAACAAPLFVSGQVWQVHQERTDASGQTVYWTADFPALQLRAWTPLPGGAVAGLRLTSASRYGFRGANGNPVPGMTGSYRDWAVSLGSPAAAAPGSRLDVRVGYQQESLHLAADDGSWVRYTTEGIVVGADLTLRLQGALSAFGQVSLVAAGRATYEDSAGRERSTRADGSTLRFGAVYDTGRLALEGGYQFQTATAHAGPDWNPAVRLAASGPYVGLRARF